LLIDYLRYQAYHGPASGFFEKGWRHYVDRYSNDVDPSQVCTGLHLRFRMSQWQEWIYEGPLRWTGRYSLGDLGGRDREYVLDELRYWLGFSMGVGRTGRTGGGYVPRTFSYTPSEGSSPLKIEILVDIDPRHWNPAFDEGAASEAASYEGVPVVYRRCGPALATAHADYAHAENTHAVNTHTGHARAGHTQSGDRIYDASLGQDQFGTICGFFTLRQGLFALTCGHVAQPGSQILLEGRQRLLRVFSRSRPVMLGTTCYANLPASASHVGSRQTSGQQLLVGVHETVSVTTHNGVAVDASLIDTSRVDAALVAVASRLNFADAVMGAQVMGAQVATIAPISTLVQEEPIFFHGAARRTKTLARIAAVTIRKSIDLRRDGRLCDVGDLFMLGHRQPMYILHPVSWPGDSGAAVRPESTSLQNQWQGMIVAGDECGSYAMHAEHLWAWAAQRLGDATLQFQFQA
jgi:hypothetical protein